MKRDVSFSNQIDDFVWTSKFKTGLLLQTVKAKEAEPMMKIFNLFMQSKLKYCCQIWNPLKKEDMGKSW